MPLLMYPHPWIPAWLEPDACCWHVCREAKRQEWRNKLAAVKKEELAAKLSAAAQAEADKMAQFRALVAAQGGRIAIPKRQ